VKLFVGISELVQPHADEGTTSAPVSVTRSAALLVDAGIIEAAGSLTDVESHPKARAAERIDLGGRAVVPGFVDAHTHVVFAGERIDEMARRARGETYEEIAKAGGGIARSATLLAQASIDELVAQSLPRVRAMLARGTTTLEVKSGYGLLPAEERKHLAAIAALAHRVPASIVPTALAHVIPRAYSDKRATYVDEFCADVLPAAREIGARFCDVFVENTAFNAAEARAITTRAKALGLGVRLHVDQLHEGGGGLLAAELGATSADHLEHTTPQGRAALAKHGVIATILPGCRFFLGKGPWPDGKALRQAGCQVALATDCNPGSAMVVDLPLCATLAVTQCGLSFEEALWAITRGGAAALGLHDRGRLVPQERADFVVLDHDDWRALLYRPGFAPIAQVAIGGTFLTRGVDEDRPTAATPGRS
jgi:imidazolonepropionase